MAGTTSSLARPPVRPTGTTRPWAPRVEQLAPYFQDYRLERRLKGGVMGPLFLARQVALERWVTIEIVSGELSGQAEFAERFRQEAIAGARAGGDGPKAVFDFGQTADGHLYVVRPYLADGGEWWRPALIFALAALVAVVVAVAGFRSKPAPLQPAPPVRPAHPSFPAASVEKPFLNSLGMKFVPVPIVGGPTANHRVLFSVWQTRAQDYRAFCEEARRVWQDPDFGQAPSHPAILVSWIDARAFAQWLTRSERAQGRIGPGEEYRLPSDHEWSCAAGIGAQENGDAAPAEKSGRLQTGYFAGTSWPPPPRSSNLASLELTPKNAHLDADRLAALETVQAGYRDDFNATAPVGSFAPNAKGLYDIGSNVLEWCEDWFSQEQQGRVLRGASWLTGQRAQLDPSFRRSAASNRRIVDYGFRLVLAEIPR